jgi:hypothetical protein
MWRWVGAALGALLAPLRLVVLDIGLGTWAASGVSCDKAEAGHEEDAATAVVEDADGPSPRGVGAPVPARPGTTAAMATTGATGADAGPSRAEAPLLWWMREHTAAALREGDSAALAAALDQLATFAPKEPAYENWASIARDGADAARAGSVDGVKAACRECHAQYRNSYKGEMRARPVLSSDGTRRP